MSGSDTKLVIAFDARIGNLEARLKKVTTELKKTGDQGKKTQQELGGLGGAFSRIGSAASAALGPLSSVLGAVGVGLGIGAAVSGFMALADAVGNLGEQADQVGVTIPELQAWQALGVQFNVTADGMATALQRFTRTLGEAAEGNEEAAAKFVRLGVSIRDSSGELRAPGDVIRDVARGISELDSPSQRAAAAVGLLGRAGQQLIPILVDVGDKQTDVVTRARDMGAVISAETSASFDKFGDSLAEFGRRVYVFIANVLEPLARGIGNIFEAMNQTLSRAAQASRVRAGEGTAGDLERAQEILARQREAEARVREDFERRRTRGQFTRRELEPEQRRVEAAAAETARLEAEVTRIQGLAQAQRTQQEAEAGRARREVLQRTQAEIEADERRSAERAAAARRGQAALRDFEQREAARQATDRRVQELSRQGVTVTGPERDQIFNQQLTIARNNAVRVQSGTRSVSDEVRRLNEDLRQADQVLSRLDTQTRTPLESYAAGLSDVTAAIERVTTTTGTMSDETRRNLAAAREALAGVGFEQFARTAETGAERAAKAMREAGAGVEEIQQAVTAAVETYIADLRRLGRISDEEIQQLRERVQRGIQRGTGDNGFFGGLRSGLGLEPGKNDVGFEETIGLGIGRETLRAFDTLFDLFNEVAEGSKTAGEALREFAVSFVQSVAKIIAQAAQLAAVQAIFRYFFPTGPGVAPGGGNPSIPFGGPRMAGGAVAGGYTYLVGERGPELFTAPGAGRIISNGAFGGGVSFVVNNNAPGVVVQQEQIDERTLVASVNMARTEVQRDYQRSMRTGYGPYSETLARTHGVRRRV